MSIRLRPRARPRKPATPALSLDAATLARLEAQVYDYASADSATVDCYLELKVRGPAYFRAERGGPS